MRRICAEPRHYDGKAVCCTNVDGGEPLRPGRARSRTCRGGNRRGEFRRGGSLGLSLGLAPTRRLIEAALNRDVKYLAVVVSPENTRMRNLLMDLHLPEALRYGTCGDDHGVRRDGALSAKERMTIGFGYRMDRT